MRLIVDLTASTEKHLAWRLRSDEVDLQTVLAMLE